MLRHLAGLICGLGLVCGAAFAQQRLGEARLAAFGGPVFLSNAASRPMGLGMSGDASLFRTRGGSLGVGALAEGGSFQPALSGKGNYYFSADAMLAREARVSAWEDGASGLRLRPFAVAGYTRFFNATSTALNSANAVNFGVGVDRLIRDDLSLRVEVREQYTPASDAHALVLRVGIVAIGSLQ